MRQCTKMMAGGKSANVRRIKSCREAGIEWMELGVANLMGHACAPADEAAKRRIHINELPELPLKGCDAESCGCFWTAALPEDFKEANMETPPPLPTTPPPAKKPMGCFGALAVFGVLLIALLGVSSLLPKNGNSSSSRAENTVTAFHSQNPDVQSFIAKGERDGLMFLEPDNQRAYLDPAYWMIADAKVKEFLVRSFALECARRRGDQSMSLDVIDKQSGRVLATHSSWSGVEIK